MDLNELFFRQQIARSFAAMSWARLATAAELIAVHLEEEITRRTSGRLRFPAVAEVAGSRGASGELLMRTAELIVALSHA